MLREASWAVARAMGLHVIGSDGADKEWIRAADQEQLVAVLLEAEGFENEAPVHYVSAAMCHVQAHQYPRAITHLRAALSFSVRDNYRNDIKGVLKVCLKKAVDDLESRASERSESLS